MTVSCRTLVVFSISLKFWAKEDCGVLELGVNYLQYIDCINAHCRGSLIKLPRRHHLVSGFLLCWMVSSYIHFTFSQHDEEVVFSSFHVCNEQGLESMEIYWNYHYLSITSRSLEFYVRILLLKSFADWDLQSHFFSWYMKEVEICEWYDHGDDEWWNIC